MGFLTRLFRDSIENPNVPLAAGADWPYELGSRKATSGVNVNRETALTYAAWWRGVNLISRDVAKLPVFLYKRTNGGKERATSHPAYRLLRRSPNREMTAFHWKQLNQSWALCEGNAYNYIDRALDGTPLELIPLMPWRTFPVRANGQLWYVYQPPSGEMRKIPPEDIIHLRGLSFDGLVGYNVVAKARESLGLGMAFDTFGSVLFRNGAIPGVVIVHPGRLTPQAKRNLRESWGKMHAGLENHHKTAVLEEGMQAKTLGMSAKDAQLLDERRFHKEEIALWFGIPPHKLGCNITTSYGSLEQENQDYLDTAIDPWLVNWEEELESKLLAERQKQNDTHCIEFHRKSLIRANMTERANYYNTGLQGGWLNRDEIREEEGYNPIPDGKGSEFLVPLNMGAAGSQDIKDDPVPDDPNDGDRKKAIQAHRDLLAETYRRMAKKIGTQARRAANKPSHFLGWLDVFEAEHRATVRDAFAAPLAACNAVGGRSDDPAVLADTVLGRFRAELLDLSGQCTAAELPDRVHQLMAAHETGAVDFRLNEGE